MNFQHHIKHFAQLGAFFKQHVETDSSVFTQAYVRNNWFTVDYIKKALLAWSSELNPDNLTRWLQPYFVNTTTFSQKQVAIIMAGNIPLVGLHDLLCVLASGHQAVVKLSSDDEVLMKWVIEALQKMNPEYAQQIVISESQLPKTFDAVIATGSNNTNRYFEYYFKGKPALLRKSRNSVAVITGNESDTQMQKLADDVFMYFGLGCRNVSKLYLPEGYDMKHFYENCNGYRYHMDHHKYANNYTYHRALLLMNMAPHLDNNFLLLKEDKQLASPLGLLYYQYYKNLDEVNEALLAQADQIQCVVSEVPLKVETVPFGMAQYPAIHSYADGVDTMKFLMELGR